VTKNPREQTTPEISGPWKETVRAIFDECHSGPISVFHSDSGSILAARIVKMIEERHHAYFCEGKTMAEWNALKGEASQ
jgi:hypothetical protein